MDMPPGYPCRHWVWAAFAVLLLGGCSPLWLVNAATDTTGYRVQRDLRYGSAPRLALDVYTPRATPPVSAAPVVVFFYGGGWQDGERADYAFLAEAITALGAVTVVPDYRVYPEARFPTFVADGARALAWTRTHIAEFGGDPQAVFVMGHSAGAHIAALLALDARYLAAEGLPRDWLRGMIGLAGPYDFLPYKSKRIRDIFAAASDPNETQPIAYAGAGGPPLLLLTGDDDGLVDPGNSRRLAEHVHSRAGAAELHVYPGLGHVGIVAALWSPRRDQTRVFADIRDFIDRHAGQAPVHRPAKVPP